MTERAWLLMAAMFCACIYGCWSRLADLSHRIDMMTIIQRSQQNQIDRLEKGRSNEP